MPEPEIHRSLRPSPWVESLAHMIPAGGHVLDIACGRGRHTRLMHRLGHAVTAVDHDLSGVQDLQGTAGIELIEHDLETGDWPFDAATFDGIVVTNYLYRPHFPHLIKSLAPHGTLLFETFAVGNEKFGRPRNPDFLLQPNELFDRFHAELDIVKFEQAEEKMPAPAIKQRMCAIRRT